MADNAKKQERETLWHYTDEAGAQGIAESGVINQSTKPYDAKYGDGTYATKVPPSSSRRAIAENNYDNKTDKSFIEDVVREG